MWWTHELLGSLCQIMDGGHNPIGSTESKKVHEQRKLQWQMGQTDTGVSPRKLLFMSLWNKESLLTSFNFLYLYPFHSHITLHMSLYNILTAICNKLSYCNRKHNVLSNLTKLFWCLNQAMLPQHNLNTCQFTWCVKKLWSFHIFLERSCCCHCSLSHTWQTRAILNTWLCVSGCNETVNTLKTEI